MSKRTQQLLLMLVIGMLMGMTGVMAWNSRGTGDGDVNHNTTPSGATTTEITVPVTTTSIGSVPNLPSSPQIPANLRVGINVSDQPAGTSVFVTGLSLTQSQWIAVYEDRDGQPGNILGASHVFPGYISTSVDLLRNTEAGGKYYAAVLNDNGDEFFDRLSDLPPFSPDKVIVVSFFAR